MLSSDLDQLAGIVDALEARDDVADVELTDLDQSSIGQHATADLSISFTTAPAEAASQPASTPGQLRSDRAAATPESLAEDEDATTARSGDARDSEPTDAADADDEYWCGRCGDGPNTENGVKIHTGHKHDGEPVVLDHRPDADELVADTAAADDPDAEASTDPTADDTDETTASAHHAEADASEPASADGGIDLPAGIDASDVRAAASDAAKLYEVTDALDERTNADLTDDQVRSYLVGLDCYSEVRDIRARPGGDD